MIRAPSPDAAEAVHRESHGILPNKIIEIDEEMAKQFMGESEPTDMGGVLLSDGPSSAHDGGTRTILFTDIEGSTALTNRLGDSAAMDILHAHNEIVRESLKKLNGREVKHTGDGIMSSFNSVTDGVKCAIAIQREVAIHNEKPVLEAFTVRIGISAGEPVEESDDLFGVSVQLAARACAHANSGQIIVSTVISLLCVGKLFEFLDLGEIRLKGFENPIQLLELRWQTTP